MQVFVCVKESARQIMGLCATGGIVCSVPSWQCLRQAADEFVSSGPSTRLRHDLSVHMLAICEPLKELLHRLVHGREVDVQRARCLILSQTVLEGRAQLIGYFEQVTRG